MKYLSVFSGVEAASVAWEPLGWEPVAFSEIEPFPCAVLSTRFPHVPNLGDITKIDWSGYSGAVDVVVGGSPCQSFSVAGNRTGLAGASGLMWEYIRCVQDVMPSYFVWENVPGALSVEGGAAFKQLLGQMDDIGYSLAWRVLDAQFFGVAQRRRRVFLVGSLAEGRAAEILFERESLRWDYQTGRDERERLTADAKRSVGGSLCLQGSMIGRSEKNGPQGSGVNADVAFTENCTDRHAVVYQKTMRPHSTKECEKYREAEVACTINVFDSGESRSNEVVVEPAYTFLDRCGNNWKNGKGGCGVLMQENVASTLATIFQQSILQPVTMSTGQANSEICSNLAPTQLEGHSQTIVCSQKLCDERKYIVRRITATECERLQGFPDGWTDIPYKGKEHPTDAPRYKAMGNSMAVPVMRWIGERIDATERKYIVEQ